MVSSFTESDGAPSGRQVFLDAIATTLLFCVAAIVGSAVDDRWPATVLIFVVLLAILTAASSPERAIRRCSGASLFAIAILIFAAFEYNRPVLELPNFGGRGDSGGLSDSAIVASLAILSAGMGLQMVLGLMQGGPDRSLHRLRSFTLVGCAAGAITLAITAPNTFRKTAVTGYLQGTPIVLDTSKLPSDAHSFDLPAAASLLRECGELPPCVWAFRAPGASDAAVLGPVSVRGILAVRYDATSSVWILEHDSDFRHFGGYILDANGRRQQQLFVSDVRHSVGPSPFAWLVCAISVAVGSVLVLRPSSIRAVRATAFAFPAVVAGMAPLLASVLLGLAP